MPTERTAEQFFPQQSMKYTDVDQHVHHGPLLQKNSCIVNMLHVTDSLFLIIMCDLWKPIVNKLVKFEPVSDI